MPLFYGCRAKSATIEMRTGLAERPLKMAGMKAATYFD
jgi:hypothetical protein